MNAQAPSFLDPSTEPVEPRSAITAWRRRSGVIKLWRRALPAAIVLVVLGVVGQLVWRGLQSRAPVAEPQVSDIRIVNPRFIGRDQQGRAFLLTADEAIRVRNNDTLIRLREPRLTLNGANGQVTVRSRQGWWRERDEVAVMTGGVVMNDPANASTFNTEEAIIDTRTDIITGSTPIRGEGRTGRVSANSYTLYQAENRIVLRGAVNIRLNNGAPTGRAPEAGTR